MIIARVNHTGAIANYFREGLSDINTVADSYRVLDDLIINKDSGRRPLFRTNDDLGTEASSNMKNHDKLLFDNFYEGTALPSLFANKDGYLLPDFSQYAYTLSSCYSSTSSGLVRNFIDEYSRKKVKVKAIGNLLGSVNSLDLPAITGGFTCCVITRSGDPCFYVNNSDKSWYITDKEGEEATTDTSPWRIYTGDICCSLIHCNTALDDVELKKVKEAFLSLTNARAFGASHFVESSESRDLTAAKVAEINSYLSKTL